VSGGCPTKAWTHGYGGGIMFPFSLRREPQTPSISLSFKDKVIFTHTCSVITSPYRRGADGSAALL